MKNIPSIQFRLLLMVTLVIGFSPLSSVCANQLDTDESDCTRSCTNNGKNNVCNVCVDNLTVSGDAKVRGDLTVCGKLTPEIPGPKGERGKPGKRGKQGKQGPGGVLEYAYIYNVTPQSEVGIEADVIFDSNGDISSGITHIPGQAQITITNAGIYYVNFSVTAFPSNQFALAINNDPLEETIYGIRDLFSEVGVSVGQNEGCVILSIPAGAILTLRNHSSFVPVSLFSFVGGTQVNVNAAITIMRIQ